jgi:indole-3-acetate monooxygenase
VAPRKNTDDCERARAGESCRIVREYAWASHDVATFVYKSGGTTGLRAGTIQRLFRDMHAGTQHVVASPPVFRALGRELAGLAPNASWQFVDLGD